MIFGWFNRAERARILAVVDKLEAVAATPSTPFDARPDLKANPQAYYHPVTGAWAVGDFRFVAPEQERACAAAEIVLPVIKSHLDDVVPEDVVNDLTFEIIQALIQNRAM